MDIESKSFDLSKYRTFDYIVSDVFHPPSPWHPGALRKTLLSHPSATTFTNNTTVVASQISPSYLCFAVYSLLVYNPSRPCVTPECGFHLNQARSLSFSHVSPNQNMPSVYVKNKTKQSRSTNPRFRRSILHPWYADTERRDRCVKCQISKSYR